jgi:hypothetical protein
MEHKMISSYWNSSYLKVVSPGGCIPRRSSSLEVVFHIFKMFKIILRCSGVDLQILQSKFSWFPAISLLVWMVVAQDMWRWRRRICGGRAAGEINNKANSAQLSWYWGWAWQYSYLLWNCWTFWHNLNIIKNTGYFTGFLWLPMSYAIDNSAHVIQIIFYVSPNHLFIQYKAIITPRQKWHFSLERVFVGNGMWYILINKKKFCPDELTFGLEEPWLSLRGGGLLNKFVSSYFF